MAGEIAKRNSLLIRPIVSAHRPAGRCRFRRSGTIAHRSPSVRQYQAFTLIELLVVISIITLLMAILLPTLQRVRNQARAVVCQSNLHQSGVLCSMYTNENKGQLPGLGYVGHRTYRGIGQSKLDNNVIITVEQSELILCPMATRWELRPGNLYENGSIQDIVGGKSTAWCRRNTFLPDWPGFSGSYGLNLSVHECSIDIYPGSVRNNVPVILDCIGMWGKASPFDEPPEYEDHFNCNGWEALIVPLRGDNITYFSIDRHSGGINSLFLDFSVRKVGLKELWMLKWDKEFDTAGPWTRAGGVQPDDWPKWMKSFKDY